MKPKLLTILAGMLLTTPAQADHHEMMDHHSKPGTDHNWYISGTVGATLGTNADEEDTGAGRTLTSEAKYKTAVNFGGAIGYRVTNHIRTEMEASYRKADLDTFTTNGVTRSLSNFDISATLLFFNGYYDFMPERRFTPYLLGGLGVAFLSEKFSRNGINLTSDRTAFAYQVGGGASFDISNQVALFTDYHYIGTPKTETQYKVLTQTRTNTLSTSWHEIRFGLRYAF